MKMAKILGAINFMLVLSCCSVESSAENPLTAPKIRNQNVTATGEVILTNSEAGFKAYSLNDGYIAKVKTEDKSISLENTEKDVNFKNNSLIRSIDETPSCPSDGFLDIQAEGNQFTINQMNCSGWYFIAEAITFEFDTQKQEFYLTAFSLEYIDRRDPSLVGPQKIFTNANFGLLEFPEVKLDQLYKLIIE